MTTVTVLPACAMPVRSLCGATSKVPSAPIHRVVRRGLRWRWRQHCRADPCTGEFGASLVQGRCGSVLTRSRERITTSCCRRTAG